MRTKKKSRGKAPSPERVLIHAKTEILKSSNIFHTLSGLRKNTPGNLYHDIVRSALSIGKHRDTVSSLAFPETPSTLRLRPFFSSIAIQDEVRWAGAYISIFAKDISKFVYLSNQFEFSVLKSDYSESENILKQIEEEFGYSIWLIKNKIALLQFSYGLEAQKKYSAEIKQQVMERGIIAFLAHYASQKTEASVSPHLFSRQFGDIISNPRIPDWLKFYLTYHITPNRSTSLEINSEILRFESTSAVVDYYEALIEMSCMMIATGQTEVFPVLLKTLHKIQEDINDPRINILVYCLSDIDAPQIAYDINAVQAFNNYLTGNYKEAITLSYDRLVNQPNDMYVAEVAARSICAKNDLESIDEQSLLMQVIAKMGSIIQKQSDSNKSASDLLKIAWVFNNSSWSKSIMTFLSNEMSPFSLKPASEIMCHSLLNTANMHPVNLCHLKDDVLKSNSILLLEQTSGPDSPSISYCMASIYPKDKWPNLDKLISEERILLEANLGINNGDFETALTAAEELSKSIYDHYRNKSIQIISSCLLGLERITECIEYVVKTYIKNVNLQPVLPIVQVLELVDRNLRQELSSNISLSIIYDIYTKNFSDIYERFRNYAYEDFLFRNDLSRPSQLRDILHLFNNDSLIYYLRYICIEPIMDCSTVFEGSQDIAGERIEVCRLLCELDPENIDVYQDEIKDTHRRLMIKKKMREIEQSKIYVDLNGIKEIALRNLGEQFTRYQLFIKSGIDLEDIALRELAKVINKGTNFEEILALSLPKNEMNDLFQSIIVELRDYFISNTQHGLDAYLSVRIRHGTFTAQLRSPLESRNLITQRDVNTREYYPNTHWFDTLNITDTTLVQSLTKCFTSFSRHFDDLVQEIITEWIQVTTTSEGKGIFNFTLLKPEILSLSTIVTKEIPFDDFLIKVFEHFYDRLSICLDEIRDKIRNEAKTKFNDLINDLQTSCLSIVNEYDDSIDIGELLSAVSNARTEVQIAFDRVIEWFRLSKEITDEPYSIEDAINVSVDSMKTSTPSFSADISISTDMRELMIKGNLPSFVDVLFIIFGNIVKHSNRGEPKSIVEVNKRKDFIVLKITNEVAEGVYNGRAKKRIKKIKGDMKKEKYDYAIITEGGTGFHKINKILLHDFKSQKSQIEPNLDFGFLDDKRFFVELIIPIFEYRTIEETSS